MGAFGQETVLERACCMGLVKKASVQVSRAPQQLEPTAPEEAQRALELVPVEERAALRLVEVPHVSGCVYSCVHLARLQSEDIVVWKCIQRNENETAVEDASCTSAQVLKVALQGCG